MKLRYLFSSAIALLLLNGCSDDLEGGIPVSEGEPINFSATIKNVGSRTIYGDLADGQWPVYWTEGDAVTIYCPQAQGTTSDEKTGKYTVTSPGTEQNIYALSGLNTLKWGAEDEHHFHTFYPSGSLYHRDVNANGDGTFVVAVPREQTATLKKTETVDGVTVYRYADMDAAIMAGHIAKKRSEVTSETTISLPFSPLTTAVDIEILPPGDPGTNVGTEVESLVVTSIQIANPSTVVTGRSALAGGFKYNAKSQAYSSYTNNTTTEDVTSTTVNVQLPTGGVTLTKGESEKLVVTAFMLPKDLPKTIRVIINCKKVGATNTGETAIISKDITYTNDSDVLGKKNTIKLGELPNPIVFSYETWMASLPDDTYVSQISLPGTHDAGAYPADEGSSIDNFFTDLFAQTQGLSILKQLDAGIRVLDFRPKWRIDKEDFNIAHGAATYEKRTFDIVMNEMLSWLAEHPTEFVIVLLKNEYGVGDWDDNKTVFFGWIKNINKKLRAETYAQYTIEEFDPAMTLKDARGKMLYMSRDYYAPCEISDTHFQNVESDWNTYQNYYTDWYGCKISGWPDNKKQSEAGEKSFYVKNPNSIYSPTAEKNELKSVGKFYYSDYYKDTFILDYAANQINKNSEIQTALTKAKNETGSTYKDVWYMTWLNVYSSSASRSDGHNSTTATYIKNNFSTGTTYHRTGIIMADWIDRTNGQTLVKTIIDNNFKAGGPAKKE